MTKLLMPAISLTIILTTSLAIADKHRSPADSPKPAVSITLSKTESEAIYKQLVKARLAQELASPGSSQILGGPVGDKGTELTLSGAKLDCIADGDAAPSCTVQAAATQ